jgi:nucleotide-binding universal stress UspA family protein
LACKYDAELEVLYVVTQQARPIVDDSSQTHDNVNLTTRANKASEALGVTLSERGLSSLTSHVAIGEGGKRASEAIVDFAKQMAVDLIVMASHGLTGIEQALMGSTTERVVRTAPCPVLTVHRSRA